MAQLCSIVRRGAESGSCKSANKPLWHRHYADCVAEDPLPDVNPPTQPTVTAVVVNWNGGSGFLDCLASLHDQSRPFDETIVVDNASADGSADDAVARFDDLRLLRNATNLGFGPGVNRGVEAATGDWVALLNNDAVADREWLARMLAAANSAPDVGMIACKIYLDRAALIIDKVGHRLAIDGQNFGRGHGTRDAGQYDQLTEVAWPDGCAALWRRDVFRQVGGIDEEFFAYADDADLGIRFRLAGWRCAFAPRAIVEHRHSQTLGAYSARKLYLVERNRIWLAMKYFPWPLLLINPVLWTWRAILTLAADRHGTGLWANVPGAERSAVVTAILRAQLDGWIGGARQLKKRLQLRRLCGAGWQQRFRVLLRDARVPLADVARVNVI
ncbi:MAG TPA: glycosyltransferase family 2 protein [Candidatus Kryptonia bacterium]|nr:glycosyltransferase family 2 protein [Candidatus Kryptonia bacterium]